MNLTPEGTLMKRNAYNKRSLQVSSTESMRNEMKALKVLGIVFIAFIVAWLPLCMINIGSVLYNSDLFNDFIGFFTYLGCISSTFNPIIYTAFNERFRQNFFEILRCTGKNKRKIVTIARWKLLFFLLSNNNINFIQIYKGIIKFVIIQSVKVFFFFSDLIYLVFLF